jgi:hypothetical protein
MKRFLLVIALALGLLAASALPAIADEHGAKRSNWSHDRTKVYTTTAVNQHNLYGDLQGILKFRQGSALNTGNFDIQIDYVRLYRVLPDRSGLLVVGKHRPESARHRDLDVREQWVASVRSEPSGRLVLRRLPLPAHPQAHRRCLLLRLEVRAHSQMALRRALLLESPESVGCGFILSPERSCWPAKASARRAARAPHPPRATAVSGRLRASPGHRH